MAFLRLPRAVELLRLDAAASSPLDYAEIGGALVVAPHPDDESIGCGGTIAELRARDIPVAVVLVTDGDRSHPGSRRFPAERLAAIRRREALAALSMLGVAEGKVHALGYGDSALPPPHTPEAERLVDRLSNLIREHAPRTIFTPWRDDPHRDHREATAFVLDAARRATRSASPMRLLEYPVWSLHAAEDARALERTGNLRRVALQRGHIRKHAAIAAHRSQYAGTIDDDPDGFQLTSREIDEIGREPYELFLETRW